MKRILFGVVMVLSVAAFSLDSRGDELKLKDGSTVVGKLVKEIPGKSYRMLVSDGSEIVYAAEKVESVSLNEKGIAPVSPPPSSTMNRAPGSGMASEAPETFDTIPGMISVDNRSHGHAKPFTLGAGIGKYGIFGAELHFRPADRIGFSAGLGAWYYSVKIYRPYTDYDEYNYYYNGIYRPETTTESGVAAGLGIKEHFYFTGRNKPSQHSLFLYQGFSDGYGPAIGCGYSFEHYFRSGFGLNAGLGLIAAPSVNEYLAKKIGVDENVVDVTWVPLLFELGFTF